MALTPDTDEFSQFLRLAFLRSPNFVTGASGWTINQDGSVEFNNGIFRGVLEAGSLFIYNGTPSATNPPVASVTDNTSDRYGNLVIAGGVVSYQHPVAVGSGASALIGGLLVVYYWTGSAWAVQFQTTISNSGAPSAQLNFLAPNATTGYTLSDTGLGLTAAGQPGIPFLTGSSGRQQVIDGADSNTYGTERLIQQVSPRSQSFSAVAAANIGGLSVPVVAGTYKVRAELTIEWNAAAGIPQMVFAGPAVSQYDVRFKTRQSGSSSTANTNSLVAAAAGNGTGYNGAVVNLTQAMSGAGIFFELDISAEFTFSASGTLTLQAASSIAGDAWIVFSGSWEIQPK